MKTLTSIILLIIATLSFAQQNETFDLATYTVPKGWKKISNSNDVVGYVITNNQKNTYCQLAIYKSMNSKGNSQLDFETEWQDLVVKPYKITTEPEMGLSTSDDGWEAKSGGAPFDFNSGQSIAMLVTMSGYGKRMSIIMLTNTQDYQTEIKTFLESVNLTKPETITEQTPVNNDDKNSIIGTWGANASDNSSYRMNNGIMNYISRQYTFNSNGTYSFVTKTFDPLMAKILLGKENGTYQISGNNLTITPKKSVIEGWSKKNGSDKWGKLLNSQNIGLEKVTYQFTKYYFSGIQIWNLVLQANKGTKRDGPFSGNTAFTNAWYYGPISANNKAIELPDGQQITTEEIKKETVQQTAGNNNEAIYGTWGIGTTIPYTSGNEETAGTTITQYTFNANGTYSFYIRTFRYHYDKLLLTRESGTYQIGGNNITINPQKAVIEAWSKKDGTDNWGKLLSSQPKALEKTTYQFTKHYSVGMQEWDLVLQANNETQRDGAYNGGTAFSNGWIYSPITYKECFIKLPGE